MPTDEERAAFKRSEYEAAAAIMAGDRWCPDPSVHEAASPAALDARCPTCGREAIPASITTGHEHGPMETCDECQYHPTEQDDGAATPPLDVLTEAIASALFDTPHWTLTSPPYDPNDRYENRHRFAAILARKVRARLAQQDGTGETRADE